jgi:hypothetical protein
MSLSARITEAWGDIVDRSEPYFDDITTARQRGQYASQRRDRLDGRFLPVYDNEVDLAVIRSMGRLMHERVPMAKAKTRRLTDYTISRGFDWTVTHESPELSSQLTAVCEAFVRDNKWTTEGERESFEAECVDGEFVADLRCEDGDIALALLTADCIVEPSDSRKLEEWKQIDYPCSWSFGVATKEHFPNHPKWYHVVRDDGGSDWDLVPAKRMIHWKRNVPQQAKRGFSDHYTTHVYLGRADKVLANTAEGAAVQAAIAYIVEHVEGTTSRQAQNVIGNLTNTLIRDPVTGAQSRAKKIIPGQRVDIPYGMKYHAGLLGANASTIYIQVMESLIRLSGTVEAMPEHMITGFAGNNNFASSLTAESPFIQGRLTDQEVRKMRLEDMLLKVVRMAYELGRFKGWEWDDIQAGLEITIQPAQIVSRDPVALTTALSGQKAQGWVSDRTASQMLGLDYEQEQENISQQKPAPGPGESGGAVLEGEGGAPAFGSMSDLSRQQWKRNKAAVDDVVADAKSGARTPAYAKAMLKMLGLSDDEAAAMLDEDPANDPVLESVRELQSEVARLNDRLGERQSRAALFGY